MGIAVSRGSCESLFLRNSGHFSLENQGNSVLNFGSLKTSKSLRPKFFPSNLNPETVRLWGPKWGHVLHIWHSNKQQEESFEGFGREMVHSFSFS